MASSSSMSTWSQIVWYRQRKMDFHSKSCVSMPNSLYNLNNELMDIFKFHPINSKQYTSLPCYVCSTHESNIYYVMWTYIHIRTRARSLTCLLALWIRENCAMCVYKSHCHCICIVQALMCVYHLPSSSLVRAVWFFFRFSSSSSYCYYR